MQTNEQIQFDTMHLETNFKNVEWIKETMLSGKYIKKYLIKNKYVSSMKLDAIIQTHQLPQIKVRPTKYW